MFSFLMDCIIRCIMESRVLISIVAIVMVELTPFEHNCVYKRLLLLHDHKSPLLRQLETKTTCSFFGDTLQFIYTCAHHTATHS